MKIPNEETRTLAQLREQYEIEKELASRLRLASKEDRKRLYALVYDEMFNLIPHHPQLIKKHNDIEGRNAVDLQMRLLKPFLKPSMTFLEIGAGSCDLSVEVAKYVKQVYAIDVSEEIAKDLKARSNFDFIVSDGCSIPIPDNSVNLAYSYQLVEHLHPDDTYEQLQNIYKAIACNGIYICVTTNRLSGPHDVSKYFDDIATGFHLKEYTGTELHDLFRRCGFSELHFIVGVKGSYFPFPFLPIKVCERILASLPVSVRRGIVRSRPFANILEVTTVVGVKH